MNRIFQKKKTIDLAPPLPTRWRLAQQTPIPDIVHFHWSESDPAHPDRGSPPPHSRLDASYDVTRLPSRAHRCLPNAAHGPPFLAAALWSGEDHRRRLVLLSRSACHSALTKVNSQIFAFANFQNDCAHPLAAHNLICLGSISSPCTPA
jgi:hypothetical protein